MTPYCRKLNLTLYDIAYKFDTLILYLLHMTTFYQNYNFGLIGLLAPNVLSILTLYQSVTHKSTYNAINHTMQSIHNRNDKELTTYDGHAKLLYN